MRAMAKDAVDRIVAQWRKVRPELRLEPMAIVGRLGRVGQLGRHRIEAGLGRYDLTIAEFDVLAALRRAGPPFRLTPTQLYSGLMLSSGAMTNRIDRLEQRGLVERLPDPSDRRGVLVGLTAAGVERIDRAVEGHLDHERAVLAPLTRDEQRQLDGLLRKLLAGLEDAP